MAPPLRFKTRLDKCIQGIHFLALHQPGITQYYIGKVFFFADREHLFDWGRPISGDRYVAMEHGPVPSGIYDLLKDTSGEPDEVVDTLSERVDIRPAENKRQVFSRQEEPTFPALSESDKEYLLSSLETYGKMSFKKLKALSHEDPAYEQAWSLGGLNNEMDPTLWLDSLDNGQAVLDALLESSCVANRRFVAA